MKSILSFLVASLFLVPLAEARRTDNVRENRQEARIRQGVKSGELTKHEAHKLRRGQHRVDVAQKKAMADGQMSDEEKVKIAKMQDNQSKKIYNQKHDGQDRNGGTQVNQNGQGGANGANEPQNTNAPTETNQSNDASSPNP